MIINDLTNTDWLFNNEINDTNSVEFSIDFTSNGNTYDTLRLTRSSLGEIVIYYVKDQSSAPVYISQIGWENNNYKQISITSGNDTTTLSFINWLQENATLTNMLIAAPIISLEDGIISWEDVTNATDYEIYYATDNINYEKVDTIQTTTYKIVNEGGSYYVVATNNNFDSANSNVVLYTQKNILLHPQENGVLDKTTDLFPKTKYENIIDMIKHITSQVIQGSDKLITSDAVYQALQNVQLNDYVVSATVSGKILTLVVKVNGITQTVIYDGQDEIDLTDYYTKQETDDLLDDKVDKVSGKGLSTNDFTTNEKDKLASIQQGAEVNVNADWNAESGDAEILNKPTIPTKTSELQNDSDFATEDFVNSSIATNTAYFLGTYNLVTQLELPVPTRTDDVADALPDFLSGLSITPTNNDYLFVQVPIATNQPTVIDHIDRYKYNAQYEVWGYEYTLNNSSFTQAQWDAINSGITSGDVDAFIAHIQNTSIHVTQQDKETWGAKQNAITSNNQLSSDLVNDTNKTHKFVTGAMYDYLEGILYQAPVISVFQLYYNGNPVATTLENGSIVTVNQIRHQETNIANISSLTFNGQSITPSATATIVNLTTPITVSATATYTMSGVNTRNASFTKGATITVNTYAYSALTSSTTAPTTGLTRQSVDSTFRSSGASFNYVSGDYLYLYTTYSGATKIQTNVLGQWADVNTTVIGQVTITKSNGVTQTYYCFRTTSSFSASGTATYRVA